MDFVRQSGGGSNVTWGLPLAETAGDLAARTHCKRHVAMMKMMTLRTYKCNSLDCLDVFNDV